MGCQYQGRAVTLRRVQQEPEDGHRVQARQLACSKTLGTQYTLRYPHPTRLQRRPHSFGPLSAESFSASFAIVPRCTSSGPSAMRSVRAPAHRRASGVSPDTPAPPCACTAASSAASAAAGASTLAAAILPRACARPRGRAQEPCVLYGAASWRFTDWHSSDR